MAAGSATWAGISSLSPDFYEASLFTLRATAALAQTITIFNDQTGMNPRKGTTYPAVSVSEQTEGQETASEGFNETLLATLTPISPMARVNLTDQRMSSDDQNAQANLAEELGAAMADYLDLEVSERFNQLTGGTIGAAGGTITWANIVGAVGKLRQAKVRGPLFCALGEGQWGRLFQAMSVNGSAFAAAPMNQDRLLQSYYTTPLLGGLTFVVTPNIAGAAGTAGTAAVYSPLALAYDERKPFTIGTQREEVARRLDVVGYMDMAIGVWAAARGITLIGTDVVQTS